MRYRRPGPGYKKVIIPGKTELVNGVNVFHRGVFATFEGNPPKFDSEKEAEKYVEWEVKARKVDPTDMKRQKARIKEIDKLIQHHLETDKTFIDYFDKNALNRIMRDVDQYEELKRDGAPICDYCTPPNVFEFPNDLLQHQLKEHRDIVLKQMEEMKVDEIGTPGGDTEEIGQAR